MNQTALRIRFAELLLAVSQELLVAVESRKERAEARPLPLGTRWLLASQVFGFHCVPLIQTLVLAAEAACGTSGPAAASQGASLVPVPAPGAACPAAAADVPGCMQWPDPTVTCSHTPCHSVPGSVPGLPLAAVGSRTVA